MLNPVAGRGRGARSRGELQRALAHEADSFRPDEPGHGGCIPVVDIIETTAPGVARVLARRAADAGALTVVAAGGDGTFGEVASGLAGSRTRLALVPLGTGNDFARALGIGRDIASAVHTVFNGRRRPIDLGQVRCSAGERVFLNAAGCGFDAAVGERVNRGYPLLRGSAIYVAAVLGAIRSLRPVAMRIEVDGCTWTLMSTLCVVSNGPRFGGGMRIAPGARPDDGVLEVCVVSAAGRLEFVRHFPRVYRGTHVDHPKVTMLRGKRVRLEGDEPVPMLVDGDLFGSTPAEITVLPRALEVLVP